MSEKWVKIKTENEQKMNRKFENLWKNNWKYIKQKLEKENNWNNWINYWKWAKLYNKLVKCSL